MQYYNITDSVTGNKLAVGFGTAKAAKQYAQSKGWTGYSIVPVSA